MDSGVRQRGTLSIPSFASERCRAMTAELIGTLEGIPPTDDTALEDRALACFVVACGELALMNNTVNRDTVVEQLTVVARKLVATTLTTLKPAAAPKSAPVPDPPPTPDLKPDPPKEFEERPGELAPHVGMTWDELEAVLKRERAERKSGL
jgi:hypothetical protein